ncbi:hypothetical protein EV193_113147 [Herbihabitans rhizosphaerae]|uniref:Acetyltransferase (GNAT) family protein n=1 Tax=Herbihabitans rhizosphaerae TaxID=1872711 RepID=A0A4Q7KEJ2_9PSEU|nr:hypothetical protein [Herbihabitans rhizosphaerae]RZS32303.1 hypothetical protein EV193_113147 [Herbihabitans rhizosphaerae]
MHVQAHTELTEFAELAMPVFAADPVRHTLGLSVLRRYRDAPAEGDRPPVLLTVHDDDQLVGVALRTPWRRRWSAGRPAG